MDEGVNYVAGRYLHGRGAFTLTEQGGEFRVTLPLRATGFLNLRATVHPADSMPTIAAASLGRLPLPDRLVDFGIAQAVRFSGFDKEWQMASRAIRNVAFDVASETVTVTYEWEPLILDRARAVALSPEEIKQLREARQALAALLARRAPGSVVSLAEILRATLPTQGDNPVGHGRAALLVLASHLAHIDLAALVPAARAWPHVRWVQHYAGRPPRPGTALCRLGHAGCLGRRAGSRRHRLVQGNERCPAWQRLLLHRPGSRPCRHAFR